MRQEWREYWYYFRIKLKFFFWFVPVSLLFFVSYLPTTPREFWLRSLGISLGFGFIISMTLWVVFSLCWYVITVIKIRTGQFYPLGNKSHLIIGTCASILGVYFSLHWKAWLLNQPFAHASVWSSLLLCVFINLGFVLFYAYRGAKEENLKLQAVSAEANYRSLKNQMQPHFLFNSLNSLSELMENNPQHACSMTQKLADLYREILENSKSKLSSLESELSIVRKYLELEQLRYGHRLDFSIQTPSVDRQIQLPSLLLQTLVENAIKHGVSKLVEGGTVSIIVQKEESSYKAAVSNSGPPFQSGKDNKGTGLENTRSRLELLYPSQHHFNISSNDGLTTAAFQFSGERLA